MSRANEPPLSTALPAGCLFACGSAALTGFMLFLNGSLVMALLSAAHGFHWEWLQDDRITQFLLFSMPLCFAVLEWMAIDYVRTRFSRPPQAPD